MSARVTVATFGAVAVLGGALMLAAGAADNRWTAFSLEVRAATPVATLGPGQEVCQGPVEAETAFGGIRAWISPSGPPGAAIQVTVHDPRTGALLAAGRMSRQAIPSPRSTALDATLPRGRRVSVCLRSQGPTAITLIGDGANARSGTLSVAGRSSGASLALVFLRRDSKSLLSLVPTLFSRAALFRPGWVGVWTFWALTGALLAAFALAALAVAHAARSDIRSSERTSAQ